MVSQEVNSSPKKWSHPFVACSLYDDFKISLQPICSSKSHKCDKYDKTTYKISPYCQFPQPDHQAIHCPVTNFGPLVRGSVTNPILITAFDAYLTPRSLGAMSLVHKYINLKESYKQDIKEKVTIKKCLGKKAGFT